jgi:glycosidase
MISQDQFELGKYYLKTVLKNVEIEVDGCRVDVIQHYELPTPETAKMFAESLKKQFEGE